MFSPRETNLSVPQMQWLLDQMKEEQTNWQYDPHSTLNISYMESSELRIQLLWVGQNQNYRVTTW